MATQIQFRRGTALQWTTANPVLAQGELGLETDTDQIKIGDGATTWSSLPYGGIQGPAQTTIIQDFGDGSDGDVSISSGVTNLIRDMYYNNLTLSGTGAITTNNYKIFVKNELNIVNAAAGAIRNNGANGADSVSQVGGTAGAINTVAVLGSNTAGGAGATGVVGVGAIAAAPTGATPSNGGASGAGGAGGAGGSGAGGALRSGATATAQHFHRQFSEIFTRGTALIQGGAGAPGGSSGAGDGVNLGRGGGGGAAGGGVVVIYAKQINRDVTTAAGTITANAGTSGMGATASVGNVGGGGGAGGAGGGYIWLAYEQLLGSASTNSITANGGAGGNGGNGFGTGIGGNGGTGGNGGNIFILKTDTSVGVLTTGTAGVAGTAGVGNSAGNGGAGGTCITSL